MAATRCGRCGTTSSRLLGHLHNRRRRHHDSNDNSDDSNNDNENDGKDEEQEEWEGLDEEQERDTDRKRQGKHPAYEDNKYGRGLVTGTAAPTQQHHQRRQ